jgi:peptide-methionine (S)-S-oxide reductase
LKRHLSRFVAFGLAAALLAACQPTLAQAESVVDAPAAARVAHEAPGLKRVIFSGGCYWGVEAVFSHVKGVTSAVSGFHGGAANTARYETVSGGATGHAESVLVTYDPTQVRYDQLLRIFFSVVANPTERNFQGPDHGSQYRSALVPLDAEQRAVAAAYLDQLSRTGLWKQPIVTRIEPYRHFYSAAPDHQDFMARYPDHPYIQAWDVPKVAALKRLFPAMYKVGFTRG